MLGLVTQELDPRRIPGCRCWLRSDKGITLASGSVSRWANQVTGVPGDATATVAPAYGAGVHGIPRLVFNGSDTDLRWGLRMSGAKTIAVVLKLANAPGTGFTVLNLWDDVGGLNSEILVDLDTYQPVSIVHDYSSATGSGHNDALGTSAVRALIHTYNGGTNDDQGSYTARLDGAPRTVAASGAFGLIAADGSIGCRAASPAFVLDGDIYEIIVYNRVLTATEQLDIYGYLKARYRL